MAAPGPASPPPQAASRPVLEVSGLSIQVATPAGAKRVVEDLGFSVASGETLCIAGESGSGKSITALALMGLLPPRIARVAAGRAVLDGRDLLGLGEGAMRRRRGAEIAMIFQEPMTSLNPVLTIGRQLTEALAAHRRLAPRAAHEAARAMLDAVRIPDPDRRLAQYPHEISGGMRQRVMIAMALICRPKVLIADEPTTALDVTIQAQILDLIRDLQKATRTAIILITHDMGVAAETADRVLVMREGRAVEEGAVGPLFAAPQAAYTRRLLAAVPRLGSLAGSDGPPPRTSAASSRPGPDIVTVRDLTVRFDIPGGVLRRPAARVHAVEGVSFTLRRGETLALVGESGCGKSTTGKALLNLVPWQGGITIDGRATHGLSARRMKPVRREIQMIFQDPYASLDPRMRVGDLVAEPLAIHGLAMRSEREERVAELFRRVGLSPDHAARYPHEFSGGQRQRISIARALALKPKVIVADECLAALDVPVQAQVIDLLRELQDELGLSYLFISHDMAAVEQVSHRVAVMHLGQIVEMGPRRAVLETPRHPYTRRLLEAVPIPDPAHRGRRRPNGAFEIASPIRAIGDPPRRLLLEEVGGGHLVAAAL